MDFPVTPVHGYSDNHKPFYCLHHRCMKRRYRQQKHLFLLVEKVSRSKASSCTVLAFITWNKNKPVNHHRAVDKSPNHGVSVLVPLLQNGGIYNVKWAVTWKKACTSWMPSLSLWQEKVVLLHHLFIRLSEDLALGVALNNSLGLRAFVSYHSTARIGFPVIIQLLDVANQENLVAILWRSTSCREWPRNSWCGRQLTLR